MVEKEAKNAAATAESALEGNNAAAETFEDRFVDNVLASEPRLRDAHTTERRL